MQLICRCCGGNYEKAPHSNPNICSSCEQLLEDDFPASTSHLIELSEQSAEESKDLPPVPPPANPRSEPLPKK